MATLTRVATLIATATPKTNIVSVSSQEAAELGFLNQHGFMARQHLRQAHLLERAHGDGTPGL